jgi:hypothetical protein
MKGEVRLSPDLQSRLFLLLTLRVRLIAVLVSGLRMLLGSIRMLLALRMIALAVVTGGRTVSLCGVLVVLCGLVMLVSCHCLFLVVCSQRQPNRPYRRWFRLSPAI